MLIIRTMEEKDIEQVQQVAKASWNHTYQGIIPEKIQENFLTSAYSYGMMQKRLVGSFIFIAEVDGKIIGFANFSPVKAKGEIELAAIYLQPEHQGKGIGTSFLQEGIQQIEGIKEVFINVEKENQVGLRFYQAKGFVVVSEFDDDFDGHILKTVRMVLKV